MPIKKKKISELNEAGDLTGFFTIGYRIVNGVKESVKYGLQKIQDLYENLIKAISAAGEATADMRELETTVETNENARSIAESERSASEQARQTAETNRVTAESARVNAEDSRSAAESDRVTSENVRVTTETSRQNAENARVQAESARVVSETARIDAEADRVTVFAGIKQNAETATSNANTATESAYAAAEAADVAKAAATEVAEHPTYVGTDNYVYAWNTVTKSYDRTNIYVKGEAFNISRVYDSVSSLEADTGNADIKEGAFVLVNTNDVENPDNARLYVKVKNPDGSYRYNFLVDMSGAIGFTGKTPQFTKGIITTSEAGTDVQLSLSESGTDPAGNPVVALNLVIPRGNPGVPFKVLGHYDTLDALKAAVPDGTNEEGVYAVGMELPYEYYAWAKDSRVVEGENFNDETWVFTKKENGIESTHTTNSINIINVTFLNYMFGKRLQTGETFKISFRITGLSPLNYTLEELMNGSGEISDLTGFGLATMFGSDSPDNLIDTDGIYSFEYTNTGTTEDAYVFAYFGQPGPCDIRIELILEPLTGWINQGRLQGIDGKSAYQVAVDGGFSGTEAEWLASLKGQDGVIGADGISCTHSWKGTTLTVTSASGTSSTDLKGEKGDSPHVNWNETDVNSSAFIENKPSSFPPLQHNHTRNEIIDFPASLPASDVYAWAKASAKPSYSLSEISDADPHSIYAGTVTKKVISAAYKIGQGYISHVALGLSNPAMRFSPAILSVGLDDNGTNWRDFVFDTDGSLHASGGFFQDSDIRLKSNIKPLSHTLKQLLSIPTASFQIDGKTQIGSIAQEVEKVCPEIVCESYRRKSEVRDAKDWEIEIREESSGRVEYVKIKQVEYEMIGILALEGVQLLYERIRRIEEALGIENMEGR